MFGRQNSPLSRVVTWLLNSEPDSGDQRKTAETDLNKAIHDAKENWISARSYFDSITDPELVDYAIYTLEAAERKYMYLLKQKKEEGDHAPSLLGM